MECYNGNGGGVIIKASTVALQNLIKQGVEVHAVPKLVGEWEHNRYTKPTVTALPAQNADTAWSAVFDLDSVALPNRPDAGAAKARLDATNKVQATSSYRDLPTSSRFYVATADDPYKYWSSTQTVGSVASGGSYQFSTPIELSVVYDDMVVANKIVVGFETSYAKPVTVTIEYTIDGTTWNTASAGSAIDSSGKISVWRDSAGGWTSAKEYNYPLLIKGVKVVVYSMNTANTHLDVIQLGARLENDLSDFVQTYDKTFEVSDRSFIAPLGAASSNEATVTLDNTDGRFNNDNEESPYYGILGKKVKFTMELSFDCTEFNGSPDERLREFTMWVDSWGNSSDNSVEVSLKDSSVFLQEADPPQVFWQGSTSGAVIWQLMDILGFSNYYYSRNALDSGQVIPYFWPVEADTAWDLIDKISQATQTAVFYDEYDVMQIRTRKAMYHQNPDIDWNFDAIQNGQKLPDVVSSTVTESLAANKVNVRFKPAHYSDFNNGLPQMETVWQPEDDTVTLRATSLIKDLAAGAMTMWIPAADATYWPYESDINIRGEILHYKGKEYMYNTTAGKVYGTVYSLDDQKNFDDLSDQDKKWANAYTGKMFITQRDIGGTGNVTHSVKTTNYTIMVTSYANNVLYQTSANQLTQTGGGYATLVSVSSDRSTMTMATHPLIVPSSISIFGMKFRFPVNPRSSDGWACGGLRLAGDSADSGIYLEISPTDVVENIEKRATRNEVSVATMPVNGRGSRLNAGATAAIVSGEWHTLDCYYEIDPSHNGVLAVYLDGTNLTTFTIPSAKRPTDQGRFSAFVRGLCNMDIDYLYCVHQDDGSPPDTSTYLDLVSGGYTSGYIQRDWRYGGMFITSGQGPTQPGWTIPANHRVDYAFDEFSPVVHEIRQFVAAFDDQKVPVISSFPYLSNSSQVYCTDYWSDPFGAKFTLANASRQTAIVNGDDDITFGTDNTISQKLLVYGRALYQDDDQTVTKSDDLSIRRNGLVSLDFDSNYVQTQANADDLAQWVIDEWSGSADEVDVEIFGNPLLQLGDLGTMNDPTNGMYPDTHRYYVVSIRNSWSDGLESEVILRRARL